MQAYVHDSPNDETPRLSRGGWLVAAMLSLALVGMGHNFRAAFDNAGLSVEEGAGLDAQEDMEENLASAAIEKFFSFGMIALIGVYCFATRRPGVLLKPDLVLFLAIASLAWVVCSLAWSVEPGETRRELVRVAVYSFTAMSLAARFRPRELCVILAMVWGVSLTTTCVYEVLTGGFRPWASGYRLSGTVHPNMLSRQAALAAITAFAFMRSDAESRKRWLPLLMLALFCVLLAKSRTSLVTCAIGLFSVSAIGLPARRLGVMAGGVAIAGAVVLFAFGLGGRPMANRVSSTANMGREAGSSSLSGRVPLWDVVLDQCKDNYLLGMGYGAFWNVERTEAVGEKIEWFPRHAHNAYVETVLNLGLVGVVLLTSTVLAAMTKAVRLAIQTGSVAQRILAATLIAGMVNGLAEAAFVLPRDLAMFIGAMVFSVALTPMARSAANAPARPTRPTLTRPSLA